MAQAVDEADKTILITRPMENSQKTSDFLASKNYHTIIAPLSRIEPCSFVTADIDSQFDALCASSAAAFLAIEQIEQKNPKLQILKNLPFFCIGSKTAEAAQRLGFKNIMGTAKDADTLVKSLTFKHYRHFLYLAGKQRRPILEEGLRAQGRHITTIETYETLKIIPNVDTIPKSLIFNGVLLYSTIGLSGLKILDSHFNAKTKFLCLSQRIAQSLMQNYQQRAIIADEPTEESLLRLL